MAGIFGMGIVGSGVGSGAAYAGDVSFSGWADFSLEYDDSSDFMLNFDQAQLYLIADAQVNSQWSLFTEVELEHVPKLSNGYAVGSIELERVYLQYKGNAVRLRFGRILTPFGIRVPIHWQLLTPMLSKPPIEAMNHVQNHVVGVEAYSSWSISDFDISVAAVIHNGAEDRGTAVPQDGLRGAVADLKLSYMSLYQVGVSAYRMGQPGTDGLGEHAVVGYTNLPLPGNLLVRAESALISPLGHHAHPTHYVLTTYTLHPYPALTVGYRLGFGHLVMTEPSHGLLHTANLSWYPAPAVRMVLEHEILDLTGNDAVQSSILWLGASF